MLKNRITQIIKASLALSPFILSPFAKATDLVTVYQAALEQDPILLQAKASYQASLQNKPLARAGILPQVNGSLSYTDDDLQATTRQAATVSLSQSIYKHDNWLNLSKSEKVIKQSEFSLQQTQLSLMTRVVAGYFSVLEAMDNLSFVEAQKASIKQELEKTRHQLEVGISAITNLHEAQAQYDSVVAQEIAAQNAIELSKENLREITGQYYQSLDGLNTEQFSPPQLTPKQVTNWLELAEKFNPALLQQKMAVAAAKQDIEIAQAGHLPSADLSANYTWADTEAQAMDNQNQLRTVQTNNDGLSWTVSLNVPIYSGGSTTAQTKQARQQYVVASQQLNQVHRQIIRQVRSAYNDVNTSLAQINALQQAVVSAESALKATKAGFSVGTRTIVDVLNSTQVVYDAKRNLASARYSYINAILTLKNAAGTLSIEDLNSINQSLLQ
ncbi:TolC family outer membrane protein [Catenovulum sp. 2E275]|uniref:TolC family outer membrane protein n=1 Tax=Catenovulum sp. 2E275 TaxID=2980497 RepID=UPI0021CFA77A|nr:TolC family outer membrane protein [Catenovulum sp. 2E275]MCU4675323.1 TolC family outer membrane protein [Catenovulum sp. 2E275]